MELVLRISDEWSYRIPEPKTRFDQTPDRRRRESAAPGPGHQEQSGPDERSGNSVLGTAAALTKARDGTEISILVIGESSARGEPYEPWVSVGQIVGWKLESVFPGRKIEVDVRARGGFCLEQALLPLLDLDRKPDAVILFSGHNEFHARYGWSRNVARYAEEGPESLLGLQALARSMSSTTHQIFSVLDRFYGEAPPPPHVTRELVDHPSFTPREFAYLREEFQRRLDSLAVYCNRIGALAILIVPGSNDGAFEPSRSVLSSDTPKKSRAEFAAAFQAARNAQATDPANAIEAFHRLVAQHPEFAESHYRLAQLLARSGNWSEAAQEFVLARERDALPIRCQADFRAIFPAIARRYGCMLIDGPSILARASPHGILDDYLFHDAQHLSMVGAIALARDILDQLHARHAFGWADSTPVPGIELEECARHFEMDSSRWAKVCERSSGFYSKYAYLRHDPTDRVESQNRYDRARQAIVGSRPLDKTVPRSLTPMLPILENLRLQKDTSRSGSRSP